MSVVDLEIQGDIDELPFLMEIIKQDYRKVVGDNPNDITDTKYGNNNVMGPDEKFFMERCRIVAG
jgi:hypothetical protein